MLTVIIPDAGDCAIVPDTLSVQVPAGYGTLPRAGKANVLPVLVIISDCVCPGTGCVVVDPGTVVCEPSGLVHVKAGICTVSDPGPIVIVLVYVPGTSKCPATSHSKDCGVTVIVGVGGLNVQPGGALKDEKVIV